MNIRYTSPPMPVDVRMTPGVVSASGLESDERVTGSDDPDNKNKGRGTSMDDSVIHNVAQMFGTDLLAWNASTRKKSFAEDALKADDGGGDSD
jgi:hypothetical protein